MEEKSAHHMTSPLTYGYQPQYHYVCARQRIAHCPAVEKGTSQTAPTDVGPRRASGGGLRDPVARTGGCRGAREELPCCKNRGMALSWPQTDPSNRFSSRHLAGSGFQHMQNLSCCIVILSTVLRINMNYYELLEKTLECWLSTCTQTKISRRVPAPVSN